MIVSQLVLYNMSYFIESTDNSKIKNILKLAKAGERKKDGTYDPGSVNYLVDQKLRDLAHRMREFDAREEESKKEKK